MSTSNARLLTDEEFEALALGHWSIRDPGCDEVTFTVRRGGVMVRYVVLRAGLPAAELRTVNPATPPACGSIPA